MDNFNSHLTFGLSRLQSIDVPHLDAECLSGFQERSIPSTDREAIARHLAGCPSCRKVLLLASAARRSRNSGARLRKLSRIAAAAVLVLALSGSASRLDRGAPSLSLRKLLFSNSETTQAFHQNVPEVAYTSADLSLSAFPCTWRVRNDDRAGVLEKSCDGGKAWRVAMRDPQLKPQKVGWQGSEVWVTDRAGAVLLSRDSGIHWTRIPPPFPRTGVNGFRPE